MSQPIYYRNHLLLPADPRLRVMVPHARELVVEGKQLLVVPHGVDETKILRNLGIEVRPPVLMQYDWPGPAPFDAQRITTALITSHKRSFVLNDLGTGKTRSALFAYDYLRKTGQALGSLLVVCPLQTMRQTWEREVFSVFPHLSVSVLYGERKRRVERLNQYADVYIINHDGVGTILPELLAASGRIAMCVLDELSEYRNAKSKLFKETYQLVSKIDRVTGMTATPMPKAATDAYGQLRMIAPAMLKGMSFTRFRELTMTKVSEFRWVNRSNALEQVYKMMQPSVRFQRDECYDLPPCQYVTMETPLSPDAHKAFTTMKSQAAIEALNVNTVNAADQLNKMLQIALGAVYDVERNIHRFDVSSRLAALDSVIEQSRGKVIVFTPYKSTLAIIREHVQKNWSMAEVSGDVGTGQRERIFSAFMQSPDPHVLVAHPDCMSHGLTLTEASTIVWWGPPNSLETYEQANGRITRAGQRNSQLIVQLVGTKLEQQIFKLLERRANVQETLLAMFESQSVEELS